MDTGAGPNLISSSFLWPSCLASIKPVRTAMLKTATRHAGSLQCLLILQICIGVLCMPEWFGIVAKSQSGFINRDVLHGWVYSWYVLRWLNGEISALLPGGDTTLSNNSSLSPLGEERSDMHAGSPEAEAMLPCFVTISRTVCPPRLRLICVTSIAARMSLS